MTKIKRQTISVVLFILMFLCLGLGIFASRASAEPSGTAEAYYIQEDRETLGMWYTGEDGTKANRQNRVYGKEGLVMFYHGQTDDGNAMMSKGLDFTDNSDSFKAMQYAHYVELPSWISAVSNKSGSTTMWNNSQSAIKTRCDEVTINNNSISIKAPLYIDYNEPNFVERYDGIKKVGNTGWFMDYGEASFQFDAKDNDWHIVTALVGNNYGHGGPMFQTNVEVFDLNGNLIAGRIAFDTMMNSYVSFLVKGSFVMKVSGYDGYSAGGWQGVFFDKYEKNTEIGVSNLTARLHEGSAKFIDLAWTNTSDTSYTNIYRRKKGTALWDYLATAAPGVAGYTDETTAVATEYEYTVTSGTRFTLPENDRSWDFYGYAMTGSKYAHNIDVKTFNEIDEALVASCETAPYSLTYLEFTGEEYLGGLVDSAVEVSVKLYKDVIYDETGEFVSGTPLANKEVYFELAGDSVYTKYLGKDYLNMEKDLGSCITDDNGEAGILVFPQYVGDYRLIAVFPEEADPDDNMKGFDAARGEKDFVVYANEAAGEAPVLFNVSDAVKPGDAFTITGNFIAQGGKTEMAYAPATGEFDRKFGYNIPGLALFGEEDILVSDSTYNTGIMAIFPEEAEPGIYDIWVKNAAGWSTAITMNAARPLYISQLSAYEGLPIELVGRNLLASEFGGADNTKVKLVNTADTATEYVLDINTGIKYTAEESFAKEEIAVSNPFRIEFTVPAARPGIYDVYVSNMGAAGFVELDSPQQLKIVAKKAANYGGEVFGGVDNGAHIGNDPLDLKVSWAQDLRYDNVVTVNAEYRGTDGNYEAWGGNSKLDKFQRYIQEQIDRLSDNGGGVLYFPDGHYFIKPTIELKSGVILKGQSAEKTILYAQYNTYEEDHRNDHIYQNDDGSWYGGGSFENPVKNPDRNNWDAPYNKFLFNANGRTNIGLADFKITMVDMEDKHKLPDMIYCFGACTNMFITDIEVDVCQPDQFNSNSSIPEIVASSNRGMALVSGTNFIAQNIRWKGNGTAINLSGTEYGIIRNVDIDIKGLNNHMAENYSFLENTRFKSGDIGHGWSGRNTAYCAYNVIMDVGVKNGQCNNQGEIFYFEPPGSKASKGSILSATENTFTVNRTGGEVISSDTQFMYTQIAVTITSGRGTGQTRYFEKTPIASTKDGKMYGNTYRLCSWEDDWDVIPDHTSKYSVFEPQTGQTVYKNKAQDCAKSLMMFSMCQDSLIYGNELTRTEGIQIYAVDLDESTNANIYQRIEKNVIDGVSDGTGHSGIEVTAQGGKNQPYVCMGVVIRDNIVKNNLNLKGYTTGASEFSKMNAGIEVNAGSMANARMVIIEGNHMENCAYGVFLKDNAYGILLKNNTFEKIGVNAEYPEGTSFPNGLATEDVLIRGTLAEYHAVSSYKFYVNGQLVSDYTKPYTNLDALPVIDDASFLGWAKSETISDKSELLTMGDGTDAELYAIFGCRITLDWNYENKGVYREYKELSGAAMPRLGNPVRVDYEFDGWYTDAACTQKFTADTVTEDVRLYAKWVKEVGPGTSSSGESNSEKPADNGCGSSLSAAVIAGGAMLAMLFLQSKKRK